MTSKNETFEALAKIVGSNYDKLPDSSEIGYLGVYGPELDAAAYLTESLTYEPTVTAKLMDYLNKTGSTADIWTATRAFVFDNHTSDRYRQLEQPWYHEAGLDENFLNRYFIGITFQMVLPEDEDDFNLQLIQTLVVIMSPYLSSGFRKDEIVGVFVADNDDPYDWIAMADRALAVCVDCKEAMFLDISAKSINDEEVGFAEWGTRIESPHSDDEGNFYFMKCESCGGTHMRVEAVWP